MFDINELMAEISNGDPYPIYDRVRAEGPVLWVDGMERWLVTGYREAGNLLRHDRLSSDRSRWDGYELPPGHERPPGGMFVMDPPDHTRLRTLVQGAFTPRIIEGLRPHITGLVDSMLEKAASDGSFDLMPAFAGPLPALVLAGLLGVPAEDHELFRAWTMTYVEALDPVSHALDSDEGVAARNALEGYLTEVVAERRAHPRDDLISALTQAEDAGDRLTSAELMEQCVLLTITGAQTTRDLIGNGVHALLTHPDQLARLRAEPELIATAVDELLRYDAPVQLTGRVPIDDVEIDGHVLRRGQMVGIVIGAANRDPRAFPDPHRLDLGRTPNRHLGFGRGIHHCLGSASARLQVEIAVGALVARYPDLRLDGTPEYRDNVHVRGFASLPVTV